MSHKCVPLVAVLKFAQMSIVCVEECAMCRGRIAMRVTKHAILLPLKENTQQGKLLDILLLPYMASVVTLLTVTPALRNLKGAAPGLLS
jgi:hypothetical protein